MSFSTISFIKPIDVAFLGVTGFPASKNPITSCVTPANLGTLCVPPAPGIKPIFASGCPI